MPPASAASPFFSVVTPLDSSPPLKSSTKSDRNFDHQSS
jgi:hypothetical protein